MWCLLKLNSDVSIMNFKSTWVYFRRIKYNFFQQKIRTISKVEYLLSIWIVSSLSIVHFIVISRLVVQTTGTTSCYLRIEMLKYFIPRSLFSLQFFRRVNILSLQIKSSIKVRSSCCIFITSNNMCQRVQPYQLCKFEVRYSWKRCSQLRLSPKYTKTDV